MGGHLRLRVAPTRIREVWVLTFELDGVAMMGGLGRAVTEYVRALVESGYEVTVFMPSHGRHLSPEHRRALGLKPIEGFRGCGYRVGLDGNQYRYCVGAEEGRAHGARVVLFKGLDMDTGRILDAWQVYAHAEEKASLFARAFIHWLDQSAEVPDLVHANDWTSALAGVLIKLILEARGLSVPLVYSVHLLSFKAFPWHYASPCWSGLPDLYHLVWLPHRHEAFCTQTLWDSVRGEVDRFAVMEADVFVASSWGYMGEVLERFGRHLAEKAFVIPNVTRWMREAARGYALELLGVADRVNVRRRIFDGWVKSLGLRHVGWLSSSCRLLAVAAGRLTPTKGFDVLLRALYGTSWDLCLLLLGVSVGDYAYEEQLRRLVEELQGRALLVVDGVDERLLQCVFYAANVVAVPSRYEPFGMVSIEAQALGTPVVVTEVGGLPETVIDLRHDPRAGTGVAVPPDDPWRLAEALEDVAALSEYSDCGDREMLSRLRSWWAREGPGRLGVNVRENAEALVNRSFRAGRLRELLAACYEKARNFAYFRAVTPL